MSLDTNATQAERNPLDELSNNEGETQIFMGQFHELAKVSGWWNDARTGEQIDPDAVFGTKIALIHSEVSEALEGHRKGLMDEHIPSRLSVEVELADAVIRIFDLAGAMNLDVVGAMVEKAGYNAQRADHKVANRLLEGGKKY